MTRTARTVTVIPPTINPITHLPGLSVRKRRVAGYARVSTDHEDQVTSYEAQVDYYTNYIKGRDDWEFVAIYTDEGISATNTKRREGFKAMVADALAGKDEKRVDHLLRSQPGFTDHGAEGFSLSHSSGAIFGKNHDRPQES